MTRLGALIARAIVLVLLLLTLSGGVASADPGTPPPSADPGTQPASADPAPAAITLPDDPGYGGVTSSFPDDPGFGQ